MASVIASALLGVVALASNGANGTKAQQPTYSQGFKPTPNLRLGSANQSKQTTTEGRSNGIRDQQPTFSREGSPPAVERPFSASQNKQATNGGLSYETPIPRPTVKGSYEPKVVPYPEGKPVFVNGYYRKDGTYVQPHFRSLPRR
jgi:hypothetical protein